MRKIREVLRLTHELKLSVRQVSEAVSEKHLHRCMTEAEFIWNSRPRLIGNS